MSETPNMLYGNKPIGTLCYIGQKAVDEPFCWSWGQIIAFCYEYMCPPGTYVHLDHAVGSGQIQGRNELVQKMQGEWICFLDSDHAPDPDIVFRMFQIFENAKLDILTGLYLDKYPPHLPVVFCYDPTSEPPYRKITSWGKTDGLALLPIQCAGAGCLMIRKSVFQRIRQEHGCDPFDPCPPYFTDDFAFFERCRRMGIQAWCAPDIEAPHLAMVPISMKDYDLKYAPPTLEVKVEAQAFR